MYFIQIFCAVLALIGTSLGIGITPPYGAGILPGYVDGAVQGSAASHGVGAGYGIVPGYGAGAAYRGVAGYLPGQQIFAPKPYNFAYDAPDGFGNSHFRTEQGNANGVVQGSYGYTDSQGLYRQVDYVADAAGFRANIRTNEPGTDGKESPAAVNIQAQPPPPGVQERYTRVPIFRGGAFGTIPGSGVVAPAVAAAVHRNVLAGIGGVSSGYGYGYAGHLAAAGVGVLPKYGAVGQTGK